MPDENPNEPEVSDLSETAAVEIPDFKRAAPPHEPAQDDSVYEVPDDVVEASVHPFEVTLNVTGDVGMSEVARAHLSGLLEALIFASDRPLKSSELAKSASAATKDVKEILSILQKHYQPRGIQLDEVAGGWVFRTSPAYAPFVRDLTKQKPVRLSRAQIETLAILAYRQPVTRPEIDDIRGVDSGPVLKVLLERDLVRILGKKDEPGRPLIYGTTTAFLEFFGLKSLKDLPTLREFTELTEDSRRVAERELGEVLDQQQPPEAEATTESIAPDAPAEADPTMHDTTPPTAAPSEPDASVAEEEADEARRDEEDNEERPVE